MKREKNERYRYCCHSDDRRIFYSIEVTPNNTVILCTADDLKDINLKCEIVDEFETRDEAIATAKSQFRAALNSGCKEIDRC
jgi:hypothetical protein